MEPGSLAPGEEAADWAPSLPWCQSWAHPRRTELAATGSLGTGTEAKEERQGRGQKVKRRPAQNERDEVREDGRAPKSQETMESESQPRLAMPAGRALPELQRETKSIPTRPSEVSECALNLPRQKLSLPSAHVRTGFDQTSTK